MGQNSSNSETPARLKLRRVGQLPLMNDCHHWTDISEVPWDLQKYWQQRKTIFSLYNSGVYMTHDAWYGVTPEPVAIQNANDLAAAFSDGSTTVIDAFAGVGGNSISLALATCEDGVTPRFKRVISIERDAATLACAQRNAALYGISDGTITWLLGDSFELFKELNRTLRSHRNQQRKMDKKRRQHGPEAPYHQIKREVKLTLSQPSADLTQETGVGQVPEPSGLSEDDVDTLTIDPETTIVFASPPWGGPGYSTSNVFDLEGMEPYNLTALHQAYRTMDHALFLPRTSDIRQIAGLAHRQAVDDDSMGRREADEPSSKKKRKRGQEAEDEMADWQKIEVVQYCVKGASKAMVAYIGKVPESKLAEEDRGALAETSERVSDEPAGDRGDAWEEISDSSGVVPYSLDGETNGHKQEATANVEKSKIDDQHGTKEDAERRTSGKGQQAKRKKRREPEKMDTMQG